MEFMFANKQSIQTFINSALIGDGSQQIEFAMLILVRKTMKPDTIMISASSMVRYFHLPMEDNMFYVLLNAMVVAVQDFCGDGWAVVRLVHLDINTTMRLK